MPQSDIQAVYWYLRSAKQGNSLAQYNLAVMYYEGWGEAKNYQVAFEWYHKAAEQGVAQAQFNLALMYQDGLVCQRSDKEAMKWYYEAAKQGHASAQMNLSICYAKEHDFYSSYVWVLLAKHNGYEVDLDDFPFQVDVDKTKAQETAQRYLDSDYNDCD
ncbi:sel1 repeat family protein [Vibrio campbellii]|nr:sel1 repeat family protein [Vibrio campbellii]